VSQAKVFKAIVMCNYEAIEEGQLSLRMGQEVFVINESSPQFWFVSLDWLRTTIGYFPRAYLKRLPGPVRPAAAAVELAPSPWVPAARKA
jgi:hypothetical protein